MGPVHQMDASRGRDRARKFAEPDGLGWVLVMPISLAVTLALVIGAAARSHAYRDPAPPVAAAPPAPEVIPPGTAEAREMFTVRCVPCHGPTGGGDGIAAAALTPHPRNYHDRAWQASVTDAQIERVILEGGEAVGKSALMPANPDLVSQPAVITALRVYIRSFATE